MSHDTNGVEMIGRILTHVASNEPRTAADLARQVGAARTTTFHVLRRLEAAGFVDRDPKGLVAPGQASADLGFAAFGMIRGAGPTEALLSVLRDDTDADVELVILQGQGKTVLARRTAAGPEGGHSALAATLEETVWTKGEVKAILRVTPRASQKADCAAIGRRVKRIAEALSQSFAGAE